MRWNAINDGTSKTFLILGLLLANIAVTLSHQRAPSPAPESSRASDALYGALAENSTSSRVTPGLGGAPRLARQARALPRFVGPSP